MVRIEAFQDCLSFWGVRAEARRLPGTAALHVGWQALATRHETSLDPPCYEVEQPPELWLPMSRLATAMLADMPACLYQCNLNGPI